MASASELLDEILARPDDDAPRLAYADFLVADGDPRGELIRVQCRLAQPPRDDDSRERMALYARGQALLDAHGAEWEAPFRACKMLVSWRRGFPSSLIGGGANFLALCPTLPTTPLESLTLCADLKPTIGAIAASPELARFRELSLSCGDRDNRATSEWALGDDAFTLLARSPHLTALRTFVTGWNNIGAAGLEALASSSWIAQLTTLALRDNPLAPAGVVALARAPRLGSLRSLDLHGGHVGDEGAIALAAAGLSSLTWLRLSDARIAVAGAQALAAC